jgi:hypothetical protein
VNIRTDRGRPPGTAAGVVGTIVVHAAAASFLFSQVRPSTPGLL